MAIAVALLAQVITAAAGPDARLCVCAAGIDLGQPGTPCCVAAVITPVADEVPTTPLPDCDHCTLIPLPLVPVSVAAVVLPTATFAVLPARIQISTLCWPAFVSPVQCPQRGPPQRTPPLHFLRVVVLTC